MKCFFEGEGDICLSLHSAVLGVGYLGRGDGEVGEAEKL